jgi:hypothetical protein
MDIIEPIRADLAEVEDIAGEEMRLYLTGLAFERVRFALDVPPAPRPGLKPSKPQNSSPRPATTAATASSRN